MDAQQILAQLFGSQGGGDPRGSFFDEPPMTSTGNDRRGKALGHRLAREQHDQLGDILSVLGLQQQGKLAEAQLGESRRHQEAEEGVQKERADAAQTAAGSKDTVFNHAQALSMIYGPDFAKKWLGQQDPVIGKLLEDQSKVQGYKVRLGSKKNPLSPEELSEWKRIEPHAPEIAGMNVPASSANASKGSTSLYPPETAQARMLGGQQELTPIGAPPIATATGAKPVAPTTPGTSPSPFSPGSQLATTLRSGLGSAAKGAERSAAGGVTNIADFLQSLFTGNQVSKEASGQRFNKLLSPATGATIF